METQRNRAFASLAQWHASLSNAPPSAFEFAVTWPLKQHFGILHLKDLNKKRSWGCVRVKGARRGREAGQPYERYNAAILYGILKKCFYEKSLLAIRMWVGLGVQDLQP
eukprot:171994-Pelagomonas_calceolata.AAC.4